MIGVILWSDEVDRQAVIWCEDQGDLAFLDDASTLSEGKPFFAVGDVVRFDLYVEGNLRRAHNATILEDDTAQTQTAPQRLDTSQASAKIIPFRPVPETPNTPNKRNAQGA